MATGMDEYVEREEIRRAYEKLTRSYVNGDPYITDWRFDEMIETSTPQMLPQFGMGGGLIKESMQSAQNAVDGVAHNTTV